MRIICIIRYFVYQISAEFQKFQRKLVTDFLTWQASIVREHARPDQFITQNFDYEWIGKGVLTHDFSENETYREACRIGAEWKRVGAHLVNLQKKNRVAILIDNNSLTGLTEFPLETTGNRSYNLILRWICDTLYRMNIEYDMISSAKRDFFAYFTDTGYADACNFNFSGETQRVIHTGTEGAELLSEKAIAAKDVITLAPWDFAIVEMHKKP